MTANLYAAVMAKEKVTIYLDPQVARAMRVAAARRGVRDSEVVEQALRSTLLTGILERAWAGGTGLSEEEAMELAVREQHASRKERRQAS